MPTTTTNTNNSSTTHSPKETVKPKTASPTTPAAPKQMVDTQGTNIFHKMIQSRPLLRMCSSWCTFVYRRILNLMLFRGLTSQSLILIVISEEIDNKNYY